MTDADLRDASVESLFASAGALLDGHFLLKSGRHAGRYLEKFLVLQHPRYGVEICRRFADVSAALLADPDRGTDDGRRAPLVRDGAPAGWVRAGGLRRAGRVRRAARYAAAGRWPRTSASRWLTTS